MEIIFKEPLTLSSFWTHRAGFSFFMISCECADFLEICKSIWGTQNLLPATQEVTINRRRLSGVEERVVRPTRKLRGVNRDSVLVGVAVARGRVLTGLIETPGDVDQGEGAVPVADHLTGVHVPQESGLDRYRHVGDHRRILLLAKIELREVGEEGAVGIVRFLNALHLGQDLFGDETVDFALNWATADESCRLFAVLIVDEYSDRERLSPETIGLCIERKYLFHNLFTNIHNLSVFCFEPRYFC